MTCENQIFSSNFELIKDIPQIKKMDAIKYFLSKLTKKNTQVIDSDDSDDEVTPKLIMEVIIKRKCPIDDRHYESLVPNKLLAVPDISKLGMFSCIFFCEK